MEKIKFLITLQFVIRSFRNKSRLWYSMRSCSWIENDCSSKRYCVSSCLGIYVQEKCIEENRIYTRTIHIQNYI